MPASVSCGADTKSGGGVVCWNGEEGCETVTTNLKQACVYFLVQ